MPGTRVKIAASINPFMPAAAKPPDNFGNIFLIKAIFRNNLKENCSSDLYLQLSFKYFGNLCFIPKLFLKVRQVQTTPVKKGTNGMNRRSSQSIRGCNKSRT